MKLITVFAVAIVAFLGASAGVGATFLRMGGPAMAPAAACPGPTRALVRRELIFGTARAQGDPVGESEWQSFLDATVTPRFPDGFTVLDARGQWRGEAGLTREQSRILVIWHDRSPKLDADVEAIRSAYKDRFGQESVLRIDSVSCVSF